jgi:hypothetical protein
VHTFFDANAPSCYAKRYKAFYISAQLWPHKVFPNTPEKLPKEGRDTDGEAPKRFQWPQKSDVGIPSDSSPAYALQEPLGNQEEMTRRAKHKGRVSPALERA